PMNANDVILIGEYIWAATNIDELPPAWTALVWGEARHIGQFDGWIAFTAWYFLNSLCFLMSFCFLSISSVSTNFFVKNEEKSAIVSDNNITKIVDPKG
ncbi:unnamed protein product, partial [marine sediment metagenome]